ncbi:hypothetical protein DFH27DRAFT_239496 [Peziza echinospora]|nr:hypothetical protein DFH27DRAFT_239496 [Peziza echinospora]
MIIVRRPSFRGRYCTLLMHPAIDSLLLLSACLKHSTLEYNLASCSPGSAPPKKTAVTKTTTPRTPLAPLQRWPFSLLTSVLRARSQPIAAIGSNRFHWYGSCINMIFSLGFHTLLGQTEKLYLYWMAWKTVSSSSVKGWASSSGKPPVGFTLELTEANSFFIYYMAYKRIVYVDPRYRTVVVWIEKYILIIQKKSVFMHKVG